MDAAARAVHKKDDREGERASLRLRRAPAGDVVDSVVETFLGGDRLASKAKDAAPALDVRGDSSQTTNASETFRPLGLRCPRASSVLIGVEPSGRVCLEVRVGAGVRVSRVLSELEEAEQWLRSSAHQAAVAPVGGRMDMSYPVRRRVVIDGGNEAAGMLSRAGIEIRDRSAACGKAGV